MTQIVDPDVRHASLDAQAIPPPVDGNDMSGVVSLGREHPWRCALSCAQRVPEPACEWNRSDIPSLRAARVEIAENDPILVKIDLRPR